MENTALKPSDYLPLVATQPVLSRAAESSGVGFLVVITVEVMEVVMMKVMIAVVMVMMEIVMVMMEVVWRWSW